MIKVVRDASDNNRNSLFLYKISILNLFVAYEHSLKLQEHACQFILEFKNVTCVNASKLYKCNTYILILGCSTTCASYACDDSGVCTRGCRIGFVGSRCETPCHVKCKDVCYIRNIFHQVIYPKILNNNSTHGKPTFSFK